MDDELLKQRLRERAVCEEAHQDRMVPDNGLGWTGKRCPDCGFRYVVEMEEWVGAERPWTISHEQVARQLIDYANARGTLSSEAALAAAAIIRLASTSPPSK